ncbi:MAG: hypothetical protein IE887_05610 [Campylobacterales bacterium]|nr:hypothetical protein [Campylobacterales bacterium]
MNYREEEFYNNGYTGIDLYYGDEYVCTVSLFDEKFIGNKKSKTYIDYLEINGFQFSLTIDLTNSSVIVVIEDENVGSYYQSGEFELDAFEIIPTSYIEEEEEVRVEIPLYVPALTYTNLMSSIVYDIDTPNILPLIDVDSVERFEKYLKDEIILFRHFLDLENVDQVINKEAIEEAKEKRKEERKLYGSGKQQTEIPEKKSVTLTEEEIVDLYSTIVNKELIIPVLTWNRQKTIHQDIFDLKKNNYDSIAIRVNSSFSGFLESSDTLITAIEDGKRYRNKYESYLDQ